MIRRLCQLIVGLIPLYVFLGWALFFVQPQLEKHTLRALAMLLGGLAVMAIVQGVVFRRWLLPLWAQAISERLYAGSYLPQDDPIASLAATIFSQHRADLIPELEKLVLADPSRTRAWFELARALEMEAHDIPRAAHVLQHGAASVRHNADRAMLLWRAATLLQKEEVHRKEAKDLLARVANEFPNTAYGHLAATRRRS